VAGQTQVSYGFDNANRPTGITQSVTGTVGLNGGCLDRSRRDEYIATSANGGLTFMSDALGSTLGW
jgi:hypothetical protein